MSEIMNIIRDFKAECLCGRPHTTAIEDVRIASGLVHRVGEILNANGFSRTLLLVADRNTLRAADGIAESLRDYTVEYQIYDDLRVAEMTQVDEIEARIAGRDISVLSVGTGSVNDPCRLAAARQKKKLCIFATAPSMDGFASYSSPIVCGGFKSSYPAKSPEVIIGDTKILASAPAALKSAGFGDMIAKYIALADWQISALLTGEYYCEKIAALTRRAVDELMELADRVTEKDEYTAGKIFEGLLKTGLGMSFSQNSRPASGSEHMIAHLMECKELEEGILPNYHGDDVGVCTLAMLKYYHTMAEIPEIRTQKENADWKDVYRFYGAMADDIRKLNEPDNIIDRVSPEILRERWPEIRRIIRGIPTYEQCLEAMRKAGCRLTVSDIGKTEEFFDLCTEYSPYMRKRLTLRRMHRMIRSSAETEAPAAKKLRNKESDAFGDCGTFRRNTIIEVE
ncbi:MAG: iron-containing alcohol dehydrogenase [Clostridia bacterium]|nr:iron-containing alcohol dehydrogenase [Clostridia bacterium]